MFLKSFSTHDIKYFLSHANNLHSIVWFQVFLSNTNYYRFSNNYFREVFKVFEDWQKVGRPLVKIIGLVLLISNIVSYLMPNPGNTYISNIYDLSTHFVDYIFKRTWPNLPTPPLGQDMTQGQFLSGV